MSISPIIKSTPSAAFPTVTNKVAYFVKKNWATLLFFSVCIGVGAYTFYTERNKNRISVEKPSNKSFDQLHCNLSKKDFEDTIKLLKGTSKSGSQKFLITGPKESGKSHVAKAVSHEANVPIIEIDCDDWIGAGALPSRIENAFAAAKKKPGCVILIKHVDMLKREDLGLMGGQPLQRRNYVWNLLETEFRKIESTDRIAVFLTAKDRSEPNLNDFKFDREPQVHYPDKSQRKKIMEDLLKDKTVMANLDEWASRWDNCSFVWIRSLVLKAAGEKTTVSDNDLKKAVEREQKSKKINQEEKLRKISTQGPGKFLTDLPNSFDELGGLKAVKKEFVKIAEYLANPECFEKPAKDKKRDRGILTPKGVILHGPPGTGKTAIAGALANELKIPFLFVSGAAFADKYVGRAQDKVNELIAQAESVEGPVLLFIDEMDSIGHRTTGGMGGQETTARDIVNTFLNQIGSLKNRIHPIIIVGATNYIEILDKALIRYGRFDKIIKIKLPTKKERKEILEKHAQKFYFDPTIDFSDWAECTRNLSGADLEQLIKCAATNGRKSQHITAEHLEEAYYELLLGDEIDLDVEEEELRKTAYHEVGHALAAYKNGLPVYGVSIRPRGNTWGVTMSAPREGQSDDLTTLEKRLQLYLGGQAAEEIMSETGHTTGCVSDRDKVKQTIRSMVYVHGYGKGTEAPYLEEFTEEKKGEYAAQYQRIFREQLLKAKGKLGLKLKEDGTPDLNSENKEQYDTRMLEGIAEVLMHTQTFLRWQFDFVYKFFDGKINDALKSTDIPYDDKIKMLNALKVKGFINETELMQHKNSISPQQTAQAGG